MKPEQQRIKIAEACGWTDCIIYNVESGKEPVGRYRGYAKLVPNYLNDLNAMHEAEKVLWGTGRAMEFTNQLVGIVCSAQGFYWYKGTPDDHLICLSHATAAQRAEAFLRTLNLWVDG